jgi:hypothetical protein
MVKIQNQKLCVSERRIERSRDALSFKRLANFKEEECLDSARHDTQRKVFSTVLCGELPWIILALLLCTANTLAQQVPAIPADSLSADTARPAADSSAYRYLDERIFTPKASTPRTPRLSAQDSTVKYYLSPEKSLRRFADWSWHRDIGDFLRATPSVVLFGRQLTPSRKQAYPFGLDGNRMTFQLDDFSIAPLEPNPEPDGGMAMTDLPLAPVGDIWFLTGPMAQLFGAKGSLTSLYARPWRFSDSAYHTSIHAQKGIYGYSDVRGAFAKHYTDGRDIAAALGYRDADGEFASLSDDAYNYYSDVVWPASSKLDIHGTGYLHSKRSVEQLWPVVTSQAFFRRTRFDRRLRIGVDLAGDSGKSVSSLYYIHERDGSYLDNNIKSRLNLTVNGASAAHERMVGSGLLTTSMDALYTTYDNGGEERTRFAVDTDIQYAQITSGWKKAGTIGLSHVRGFGLLPRASALLTNLDAPLRLSTGVAYIEQVPALSDLYLPPTTGSLYISTGDYAETGSVSLKKERQLIASASIETGSRFTLGVNIAAGKIYDGVTWLAETEFVGDTSGSFHPANLTTAFATVDASVSARIANFLRWRGGAAWHNIKSKERDSTPYAPEYNAFTGGELHWNWTQTGTHLYAYGELMWTGPYHGYFGKILGEDLAANTKLTLEMKDFHLFFVFQNVFYKYIEQREFYPTQTRSFYYGLTWWFED